jgi:hypothetical protein
MYHAQLGRFGSRDPVGYVDGLNIYCAVFAQSGKVDPFGHTSGWDFIWIFVRRILRGTALTDWIVGDHYVMEDNEGTIIRENKHLSEAFMKDYVERRSRFIPSDCQWYRIEVPPELEDIRGDQGDWIVQNREVFGEGGFWLNGATRISTGAAGGWINARKCPPCCRVEIGEFQVDYVWHDNIDAKSFWEQRGDIMNAIRQREGGPLLIFTLEGLWDIFLDKIADFNYEVSIPVRHEGNLAPSQPCGD